MREEGIECYGPKEAIKYAGRLGLIEDVNLWLGFLDDRNLADKDYLRTINRFVAEAKKVGL